MDLLTWIDAHWAELLEAAAALWVVASIYVRLTPGEDDDRALTRFRVEVLERFSFLQPKDGTGVLSLPGDKAKRDPLEDRT